MSGGEISMVKPDKKELFTYCYLDKCASCFMEDTEETRPEYRTVTEANSST